MSDSRHALPSKTAGGIRKKKSLKMAKGSRNGARRFKAEDQKKKNIAGDYRLKETVQFRPPALSWSSDCSSGKRRKDLLSWA